MGMSFEIRAGGGPPPGFYKTKFVTIEQTQHEEFGAGLKFVFQVLDGEHAGEQTTRITGAQPTTGNACGRMIAGITGESLTPGKRVDLDPFFGRQYLVQVEALPNGSGSRITNVMPNWGK